MWLSAIDQSELVDLCLCFNAVYVHVHLKQRYYSEVSLIYGFFNARPNWYNGSHSRCNSFVVNQFLFFTPNGENALCYTPKKE